MLAPCLELQNVVVPALAGGLPNASLYRPVRLQIAVSETSGKLADPQSDLRRSSFSYALLQVARLCSIRAQAGLSNLKCSEQSCTVCCIAQPHSDSKFTDSIARLGRSITTVCTLRMKI